MLFLACRALKSSAWPNNALEPTANSVRCAPAVGGGSPPALGQEKGDGTLHSERDSSVWLSSPSSCCRWRLRRSGPCRFGGSRFSGLARRRRPLRDSPWSRSSRTRRVSAAGWRATTLPSSGAGRREGSTSLRPWSPRCTGSRRRSSWSRMRRQLNGQIGDQYDSYSRKGGGGLEVGLPPALARPGGNVTGGLQHEPGRSSRNAKNCSSRWCPGDAGGGASRLERAKVRIGAREGAAAQLEMALSLSVRA